MNAHALPRSFRPSLPVLLMLGAGAPAMADQILQIDGGSLTTVKYTSASAGQNLRPLPQHRAVGIDGSRRGGGGYAWAFNGNPFESGGGSARLGDLDLATGTYMPTDVDLALPAPGASRVVIGRMHNHRQEVIAAHHDSNGFQGYNWSALCQPEIVFYDDATNTEDRIYVVMGAGAQIEFIRTESNSTDPFQARNGAAGVIAYSSGSPDTYIWTDQHGNVTTFFGGNTGSGHGDWQFWKIVDPAGNAAYVGDAHTASTAVTNGYSGKRVQKLYDGASRRYCFTYNGDNRVTQVLVETDAGGGWGNCGAETMVAKAEYAYYVNANDHGSDGDLKLVTVTMPLTDSGIELIKRTSYRYYDAAWADQDGRRGEPHMLKMVIADEGIRRHDYDQDSTMEYGGDGADPEFLTATDSDLKPYAAAYLEYVSGSDYRVKKVFFNGECGCGGGGGANGAYEFAYATGSNYSTAIGNTSYDNGANDWARTVINQPDATWETRYFDEAGQSLSMVKTDGDPGVSYTDLWATQAIRDALGCVTEVRSPAANDNSYTHSSGSFTAHSGTGLITLYERETASVDTKGFLVFVKHQQGTGGTVYYDAKTEYTDRDHNISGSVYVTRPMVSARRAYHEVNVEAAAKDTAANFRETTQTYAWWSSTNTNVLYVTLKQATTTHPAVTTANNGSNSALASERYVRKDGTTAFTKSTGGRHDYALFTSGQLTKRIDDVKTDGTFASGDDPNTDWGITESGSGSDRTTEYAYDAQGRPDTTTLPDDGVTKTYYSRLKDQQTVTIGFPRKTTAGGGTYFGPASYTVTNQAGKATFQGLIAITSSGLTDALTTWIDETDADPITALDKGTLARMSTSVYNKPGTRADETRAYFSIPGSGAGSEGTNYDAVEYTFDEMGRQYRVKDATETITLSVFDDLGRPIETWVGTNDALVGGGDNMVKTTVMQYDGNTDGGNSHLTSREIDQDGNWGTTGDQGETTYSYDLRGRLMVTVPPQSPYSVAKFDNLGRQTAVGMYSSSSGLDAGDDPTSLTTNRIGLSLSYIDEMGRVWKSERCKIDQADGSNDDQLQTLTWYDPEGRVMKADGEQLTKTRFDRLGRETHQWTLAKDDDSQYSHASASTAVWDTTNLRTNIAGDHVLEEVQTTYESSDSDNVVMRATIARFHDDLSTGTTGALDTNADGNTFKYTAADVDGRIAISASWFDDLDRTTDTVSYGTYGGSDFERWASGPGWLTVPSRSDTDLRTSYTYNDDGTLLQIEDPRALKNRYAYDALGRKITEIRNYVNGTPSGTPDYLTCPDDNIMRFTFSKGLQATMWVDFDGDNAVDTSEPKDQVTTYIYGSNAGTPTQMILTTANLLRAVKYPDTTNAGTTVANIDSDSSDVVSYAYNAQGQQVYMKDQAGNIIETDLDTAGRETQRRVTTLVGGFDGAVRRISTTYVARGMVLKVSQYDNATVGAGSLVDDVKYTYDDWGNVSGFKQDVDSDIDGAASGRAAFEVTYGYAKNTSGRNTVRRTTATLPGSALIGYTYLSTGNKLDSDASRVSRVEDMWSTLASYEYNGVGRLVTTKYEEPSGDVLWQMGASGTYADLDRFDRVIQSRWTKDLATDRDFVDLDIAYDRNGNITSIQDSVHTTGLLGAGNGLHDVAYTIDDLDRLTRAKEGHWGGSAIADGDTKRDQIWTLTQTGNWELDKVDIDGDLNYNEAGELNDDRTHNIVNELTARDTDDSGSDNYTLTYDANGNLTDDGDDYEYEYDAFNRLRKVKNTSNQALIAEHRYDGLGFRLGWHYDVDLDGTVEATLTQDPWYFFCHDERWRIIATYRYAGSGTESEAPKERFLHHAAGLGGWGGSSCIDAVILRQKDHNSGWTSAADGVLEERRYYCQNWRSDVAALVTDTGKMVEWVKYSSYGVPYALAAGDTNSDSTWDSTDDITIDTDYSNYDIRRDADLDNDVDSSDDAYANTITGGYQTDLGRGKLTSTSVENRTAYAGYQYDRTFYGADRHISHVRHRVLDSTMGRWLQRDQLTTTNYYEYAHVTPILGADPFGLYFKPIRTPLNEFLFGDPGAFEAIAEVRLQETTPWPCPGQGLWIVQMVQTMGVTLSCQSMPLIYWWEQIPMFWEAWHVNNNQRKLLVDVFGFISDNPEKSSQLITQEGRSLGFCDSEVASEVPGLGKNWKKDPNHPSRGEWYTETLPSWWTGCSGYGCSSSIYTYREMRTAWDGCGTPATVSMPGWELQTRFEPWTERTGGSITWPDH